MAGNLISYQVEPVCSNFYGREEELALLDVLFQNKEREGNQTPFIIIKGTPGVGKTELAKSYCHRFLHQKRGNCIWLDHGSYRSFLHSVRRLGADSKVKSPVAGMVDVNGIHTLFRKLTSKKKCLIVLDNMHLEANLSGMLAIIWNALHQTPEPKKVVYILMCGQITEANQDVTDDGDILNLGPFKNEEAFNFLKSSLKIPETEKIDTLIRQICEKTVNSPSILNQIAVLSNNCSSSDKNTGILQYLVDRLTEEDKKDTKIAALVWKIFEDQVFPNEGPIGEVAEKLLRLMSYMSRYDITVPDLVRLYYHVYRNSVTTSILLENALNLLTKYSLIQINKFNTDQLINFDKPLPMPSANDFLTSDYGKIQIQSDLQNVLRTDQDMLMKIVEQHNSQTMFEGSHGGTMINLFWMEHLGFLYNYLEEHPELYPNLKESKFGSSVEQNRMMFMMTSLMARNK